MDPTTLDLLRSLQSAPFDAAALERIQHSLGSQRAALRARNDLATLDEVSDLLQSWAASSPEPRSAARAMLLAASLCEHELGHAGRAAEIHQRAIAQAATAANGDDAGRAIVYGVMGEQAAVSGDLDAAIAAFEEALDADADLKIVQRLADALSQRGQEGDAEQAADLYCMLGETLGNPDGVSMLERALDLVPAHAEASALLEQYLSARAQRARSGRTVVGYKLEVEPSVEAQLALLDGTQIPASQPPQAASAAQSQPPSAAARHSARPTIRMSNPPPAGIPALGAPLPASVRSSAPPALGIPVPASARSSAPPPAASVRPAARASWDAPAAMGSVPVASSRSTPPRAAARSVAGAVSPQAPASVPPVSRPVATAASLSSPPPVVIDNGIEERGAGPTSARKRFIGVAAVVCVVAVGIGVLSQRSREPSTAPARTESVIAQPTPAAAPVAVPAVPPPAPPPSAQTAAEANGGASAPTPVVQEAVKPEPVAEPSRPSRPSASMQLDQLTLKGGKLDREAVLAVLDKLSSKLDRCYAQTLKKKPRTAGSLTVGFAVRPNGRAAGTRKLSGSLKDAVLTRCTVQALSGARYPKPKKKPAQVKLPIEYQLP